MVNNVLVLSYSLNRSDHRGVYQYAKSLTTAISNNYNVGLFTQIYEKDRVDTGLKGVINYLEDPVKYFFVQNKKFRIIFDYLCQKVSKVDFNILDNDFVMVEKDSFFWGVDFFINKPLLYYSNNLDLLLPSIFCESTIDLLNFSNDDIIFTDSPFSIKSNKHKVVQTVHDLIPIQEKRKFHKYFYKRLKACSHANKILCVSEYSKQQYLEYFPDMEGKVEVVYQPLPADEQTIYLSSLPDVQQAVLGKYKLKSKQYMYYVGAIEERKNIHNLIKAYTIATNSDKSCPLVISGSVDGGYSKNYNLNEYLVSYTDFDKVSHNIMKTDFVSDIEKLVLLRNSRAFLFPSLSEGFGIPVIEAQTLGVPVMTSNNTSLPEVTNGSALLLENPLDIEEMVEGIKKLWNDDHYCSSLILLGNHNSLRFTKEKFKDAISQFLETV